jgi:sugar O-acyltransferase (sialic acid O-acetyltransferase NeuD family)
LAENIVLFGAGAHSHVVVDIIEQEKNYTVVGLIDSKRKIGEKFNDYTIIGRQEDLLQLQKEYDFNKGIVCIGDNYWRGFVVDVILRINSDFHFVNAIHPSVVIGKNVEIGRGNVLMPGVVVNTFARIMDHCIINTNSSLEHFCTMENFSSLSAGVTTGGYVEIGEYSAIALGVTLFDRIRIGKHAVVGSGALVTKDVEDQTLVYGVPAKMIRKREKGEKYLK